MKTQILAVLAVIGLQLSEQARSSKPKRGSLFSDYSLSDGSLGYSGDLNLSPTGWKVTTGDFNLNVDLPLPRTPPSPGIARPILVSRPVTSLGYLSNSLDKPVMEPQELIPPQSSGTAVLPQMPIPAVPVNALASNIPASRGAVFLGSGSLGVVNLGNGAYALGSGSLGYSENRARPRPTVRVPVLPPIRASPDLIPAAVPTPLPPQSVPQPGFIDYGNPIYNVPQVPQIDQNGYEYLPPNRVGFGTPNPPRPIRTRQQFATPTALQLQSQLSQIQQISSDIPYSVPLGHPSLGNIPILA